MRAAFQRDLAKAFERARGRKTCLGLIIGEVDNYAELEKKLGDDVATMVSATKRRIREHAEHVGLMCDLADGRFAVIVPGTSRVNTAKLAEHLRTGVEQVPSDHPMTVSIGVAALEPSVERYLLRWELLMQLADNALFTARRAGCNCVRVFTPKRKRKRALG
jgi:diguanylate cyclase (GGDEF)-like protein